MSYCDICSHVDILKHQWTIGRITMTSHCDIQLTRIRQTLNHSLHPDPCFRYDVLSQRVISLLSLQGSPYLLGENLQIYWTSPFSSQTVQRTMSLKGELRQTVMDNQIFSDVLGVEFHLFHTTISKAKMTINATNCYLRWISFLVIGCRTKWILKHKAVFAVPKYSLALSFHLCYTKKGIAVTMHHTICMYIRMRVAL